MSLNNSLVLMGQFWGGGVSLNETLPNNTLLLAFSHMLIHSLWLEVQHNEIQS